MREWTQRLARAAGPLVVPAFHSLWELCRDRHNSHYADAQIMPTSDRKTWPVAVSGRVRSA